ncbi:MAG: DUF3568 family protein [Syntrophales bacterium]
MKIEKKWLLSLAALAFLLSGCAAALLGGAAIGAGSGTYFFINGELKTDYYQSFDDVWKASEKTVAEMRGVDVIPAKEIGNGKITATINGEKVDISVSYKAKDVTSVAVRVGLVGNKLSSQLIHDKIGDNLSRK